MSEKDSKIEALRQYNEELNNLTKESLQTALISLLADKPYEKISVTDICKKAGVSRMSYYRNFESKDEILQKLADEYFNKIKVGLLEREEKGCHYEWYLDFFREVKEDPERMKLLLKADSIIHFMGGVDSILVKIKDADTPEGHYRLLAKEGGFYTIVSNWVYDGMKESPEEMAELCLKILVPITR